MGDKHLTNSCNIQQNKISVKWSHEEHAEGPRGEMGLVKLQRSWRDHADNDSCGEQVGGHNRFTELDLL